MAEQNGPKVANGQKEAESVRMLVGHAMQNKGIWVLGSDNICKELLPHMCKELITPGAADAPTKKLWPLVNLEAVLASCLKHGLSSWRKLGHTAQDRGIWMMPMPSYNRAH